MIKGFLVKMVQQVRFLATMKVRVINPKLSLNDWIPWLFSSQICSYWIPNRKKKLLY